MFDSISEVRVKKRLRELTDKEEILGFLLQGSRVTGFGKPDSDYDIIIYCSNKYFRTLDIKNRFESIDDEIDGKRKQVGDFAYFCDEIFEQQKNSPMDIDHVPYLESEILLDKTGKLGEWVKSLGKIDEAMFEDRLKAQMVQLAIAFGYATINRSREKKLDEMINLHRFLTIAVTVWFTLQKTWVPQLKWWSNHVKKGGMDDRTFEMYQSCIQNLNYENATTLYSRLKELIQEKGIELNLQDEFVNTVMPEGRPAYIKHSYF